MRNRMPWISVFEICTDFRLNSTWENDSLSTTELIQVKPWKQLHMIRGLGGGRLFSFRRKRKTYHFAI